MHSHVILFLTNLFSTDMLFIMFVGLLLFGGEKLPEIARGLGKGIRDFKDASEGIKREINDQINNFDRKEDIKKENAIIEQRSEGQNQITSGSNQLLEGHHPVQNTIPINEGHVYNSASPINDDSNTAGKIEEPVIESHKGIQYTGAETQQSEQIKNT